jgi:hypothetical protein
MTPEQYEAIGRVLLEKQEIILPVAVFLKGAFDAASEKAVRMYEEGLELTEIQKTLDGTEENK